MDLLCRLAVEQRAAIIAVTHDERRSLGDSIESSGFGTDG
jgi:hypothetical protein